MFRSPMENEVITQDALAVCLALRPYIYTWASSHDVRHHAFIHKWRKWDAGGLKRRWRRRGEISWSYEVMLLRADDSPHGTQRESTATALRCDCVCVCACVCECFITLGLLGAVHSCEEDFLCELLFVWCTSNKSQCYSGCGSRGFRPGLAPLGAASESYKPALILLCRKKWTSKWKDTRKKGSPVCPIYLLGKKRKERKTRTLVC